MRDQALPVGGSGIGCRTQESVALDAIVAHEAQQAEGARAREPAVQAVLGWRDVIPSEQSQRDVGDLHAVASQIRPAIETPRFGRQARFAHPRDEYRLPTCPT